MTEITNEYGTFRGETESEALKKARGARRKARREEKAKAVRRDVANTRAYETGYRIYEAFGEIKAGEREALPPGWWLWRPGESYGPRLEPAMRCHGHRARYETANGFAAFDHYGYFVDVALYNGAGFVIAIVLRDADHGSRRHQICAVGACDGEGALVPLSGVTLEDLEKYIVSR